MRNRNVYILRTVDGELHAIEPEKIEQLFTFIERWTDLDRAAAAAILKSGATIKNPAFQVSLE